MAVAEEYQQGHIGIVAEFKETRVEQRVPEASVQGAAQDMTEEIPQLYNRLLSGVEYTTLLLQDICQECNNVLPVLAKQEISRLWSSFLTFYGSAPKDETGRPIPAKRTSSLLSRHGTAKSKGAAGTAGTAGPTRRASSSASRSDTRDPCTAFEE